MKLLVTIIHQRDAGAVVDVLLAHDFRATRIDSAGGFLREGNATLLMGVDDERIDEALAILRDHCKSRMQDVTLPMSLSEGINRVVGEPIQVKVGGAVVFVLGIDHFEHW